MRTIQLTPSALKGEQMVVQAESANATGILLNQDLNQTSEQSNLPMLLRAQPEETIGEVENAWNRIKRGMDQTQMNAYEKLELDSKEGKGVGSLIESLLGEDFLDAQIMQQKIDIFQAEKHIKEKDAYNTPPTWWKSAADHIGYDFADVLGSSMSMIGLSLGGAAVGMFAGPGTSLALGAAGASMGRYQEALAESGGNYSSTKAELTRLRASGDPKYAGLTDADIHSRAMKASDEVFTNNMKLLALDIPLMMLSFAPLAKAVGKATAGVIGKTTGYAANNMFVQGVEKAAYLTAAKPSFKYMKGLAGYAAVMAGEGAEEGLQFAMNDAATSKALDKDSMSFTDLLYNKEFQESVKMGMELGGFMKASGSVLGKIVEKATGDKDKSVDDLKSMQEAQKTDLLFKNMYAGTLPQYFGTMQGMAEAGVYNVNNRKDEAETAEKIKAVANHKAQAVDLVNKFNATLVQYPELAKDKNKVNAHFLFNLLDQDAKIDAVLSENVGIQNPDRVAFYAGMKKDLGELLVDVAQGKVGYIDKFKALVQQEEDFANGKIPKAGAPVPGTKPELPVVTTGQELLDAQQKEADEKAKEAEAKSTTPASSTAKPKEGSATVNLSNIPKTGDVDAPKAATVKDTASDVKETVQEDDQEDEDDFHHVKAAEDEVLEDLKGAKQNIEVDEAKADPMKDETAQETKFTGTFNKGKDLKTGKVATVKIEDGMIIQPLSKNIVKVDKQTKEQQEIERKAKEIPAYDYVDGDGNKYVVGFQPVPKWKGDKSKKKFNAVASGYLIPIGKGGKINSEDVVMFYASPEAKKGKHFLRYDDWPAMRDKLGLKPVGKRVKVEEATKKTVSPQKFSLNRAESNPAPNISLSLILKESFGGELPEDVKQVKLLEIKGRNSEGKIVGEVWIQKLDGQSFKADVFFDDKITEEASKGKENEVGLTSVSSPESEAVSSESGTTTKPVYNVKPNSEGTFDVVDKNTGEVQSTVKYKSKAAATKVASKWNKEGRPEQKQKNESKKEEKKPATQTTLELETKPEKKEDATAWDQMDFAQKHDNLHNRIAFDKQEIKGRLSLAGINPTIELSDGSVVNLVSQKRIPIGDDLDGETVSIEIAKPEKGAENVIESISGDLYFRYKDTEGTRTYPYELHVKDAEGNTVSKVFRSKTDSVTEKESAPKKKTTAISLHALADKLDKQADQDQKDLFKPGQLHDVAYVIAKSSMIMARKIAAKILRAMANTADFASTFSEKLSKALAKDSRIPINEENPAFPSMVKQVIEDIQAELTQAGSDMILEKPEIVQWFEKNNDNTADFLNSWGERFLKDHEAEIVKDKDAETYSVVLVRDPKKSIWYRRGKEKSIEAKGLTEREAKAALNIDKAKNQRIVNQAKKDALSKSVLTDVMVNSSLTVEDIEAEGIRLSDEIAQKKFAFENNLSTLQNTISVFFKVPGLTQAQVVDDLIEMNQSTTQQENITPNEIMDLYVGENSTLSPDIKEYYQRSGLGPNAYVSLHFFVQSFRKEENVFLSFGGKNGVQMLPSNSQTTATMQAKNFVFVNQAFKRQSNLRNEDRINAWKELGTELKKTWKEKIKPVLLAPVNMKSEGAKAILDRLAKDKKLNPVAGSFWYGEGKPVAITHQKVLDEYHKASDAIALLKGQNDAKKMDEASRRFKAAKEIYDLYSDKIDQARAIVNTVVDREVAYISQMTGLSANVLRAAANHNNYAAVPRLKSSPITDPNFSPLLEHSLLRMSDTTPMSVFLQDFMQTNELDKDVFPRALATALDSADVSKHKTAFNSYQQNNEKARFNLAQKIATAYVNSDATSLMSSYRGVSGKRKDGGMLDHILRRVNDMVPEIASDPKFKDNAFVQMHKDKAPRMIWLEGVKEQGFQEGTDVDRLTPDDISLAAMALFHNKGASTGFHFIELLGDRGKFPAVETVKRTTEQAKKLVSGVDLTTTINNLTNVLSIAQKEGRFPSNLDVNPQAFAEQFAYNYAANKAEIDAVYQGDDEQYGTYRKLTKRASQLASTGLKLVQGLVGGVPKSVKAAIIKDAGGVAYINGKEFRIKEVSNGTTYISERLNKQIAYSSGSMYNFKDTIKGLYKRTETDKNTGARNHVMIKSNLMVLTKEHARDNGGVDGTLYQLWQAMNEGNAPLDIIAFDSSAKVHGGVNVNELNYRTKTVEKRDPKTGKMKKEVYPTSNLHKGAIAKQGLESFDFHFDDFIIQQDLRSNVHAEDMKFEKGEFPVQVYRYLMQFPEFDGLHSKFVDQQTENFNTVGKTIFSQDTKAFVDFLKSKLKDTETDNFIHDLLSKVVVGEDGQPVKESVAEMVSHPWVQAKITGLLGNHFAKEVVHRTANRFAMQEVGSYGITNIEGDERLKSPHIDANGKVQPGQALIPASLMKDTFKVDGKDYLIIIRVPTTQMHSISLVQVIGTVPDMMSNTIITDIATQFKSGSDNDGDQRFCISLFKQGKKPLTKAQKLSNDAVMSIFDILQNKEYFDLNNAEINLEAFDKYLPTDESQPLYKRDFSSYTKMWENNSDAKIGIAVAARTNAVLLYLNKMKAKLINGPTINGRKIADFSTIPEDDFEVSTDTANMTNLIVDNTKEGKMTKMGLSDSTISMYFFLRRAGVPIKDLIHLFTKHPVGVKLVSKFQEARSPFSDSSKGSVIRDMNQEYGYSNTASMKIDTANLSDKEAMGLLSWAHEVSSEMYNYGEMSRIAEDGITNNNDYLQARKLQKYINNEHVELDNVKSKRTIRFDRSTDVTKSPIFASFQMALQLADGALQNTIFDTRVASKMFNMMEAGMTKSKMGDKVMASLMQAALVNHFNIPASVTDKKNVEVFYRNHIEGTELEQYLSLDNSQIVINSTYRFSDITSEMVAAMRDALDGLNKVGSDGKQPIDQLIAYHIAMYGWQSSTTNGSFAKIFEGYDQLHVAESMTEVKKFWDNVSMESTLQLLRSIAMRYPEEFKGYASEPENLISEDRASNLPMVIEDESITDRVAYKVLTRAAGKTPEYFYQSFNRTMPDVGMSAIVMTRDESLKGNFEAAYKSKEEIASDNIIGSAPISSEQVSRFESKPGMIFLADEETWFSKSGIYTDSNGSIFNISVGSIINKDQARPSKRLHEGMAKKLGFGSVESMLKDSKIGPVLTEKGNSGRFLNVSYAGRDLSVTVVNPESDPVVAKPMMKQGEPLENKLADRVTKVSTGYYRLTPNGYELLDGVKAVDNTKIGKDLPIAIVKNADDTLTAIEPMTGTVLMEDFRGTTRALKLDLVEVVKDTPSIADRLNQLMDDILNGSINVSPRYVLKSEGGLKYMDASIDEASYGADIALQEQIQKELAKLFPSVKTFTDPVAFQAYLDKHHAGEVFDLSKLGAAIGQAVMINQNAAVQSTQVHEHAHIYFDAMPDSTPAKKRLKSFYATSGVLSKQAEEDLIIDLGKVGTEHLRQRFQGKPITKLLLALKDFWASVKALFGKETKQEAMQLFAKKMLRPKPGSLSVGAKFSQKLKYQSAKPTKKAEEIFDSVTYLSGLIDNGVTNNPGELTTILESEEHLDRFKDLMGRNLTIESVEDISIPSNGTLLLKKKVTYRVKKAMFWPGLKNQILFGVTKAMKLANPLKFDMDPAAFGDKDIVGTTAWKNDHIGIPMHAFLDATIKGATFDQAYAEAKKQGLTKVDKATLKREVYDPQVKEKQEVEAGGGIILGEVTVGHARHGVGGKIDKMIIYGDGTIKLVDYKTSTEKVYDSIGNLKNTYTASSKKGAGSSKQERGFTQLATYSTLLGSADNIGGNDRKGINVDEIEIQPFYYTLDEDGNITDIQREKPVNKKLTTEDTTNAIDILSEFNKQYVNIVDLKGSTITMLTPEAVARVNGIELNNLNRDIETNKAKLKPLYLERDKAKNNPSLKSEINEKIKPLEKERDTLDYQRKKFAGLWDDYMKEAVKLKAILTEYGAIGKLSRDELWAMHGAVSTLSLAAKSEILASILNEIKHRIVVENVKDAEKETDITKVQKLMMAPSHMTTNQPFLRELMAHQLMQVVVAENEVKRIHKELEVLDQAVRKEWDEKNHSLGTKVQRFFTKDASYKYYENMWVVQGNQYQHEYKNPNDPSLTKAESAYIQYIINYKNQTGVDGKTNVKSRILGSSSGIANDLGALIMPQSTFEVYHKAGFFPALFKFIGDQRRIEDVKIYGDMPVLNNGKVTWVKGMHTYGDLKNALETPGIVGKIGRARQVYHMTRYIRKANNLYEKGFHDAVPGSGSPNGDKIDDLNYSEALLIRDGKILVQKDDRQRRRTMDDKMDIHSSWYYGRSKREPFSLDIHSAMQKFVMDTEFEAAMTSQSYKVGDNYVSVMEMASMAQIATYSAKQGNANEFLNMWVDRELLGAGTDKLVFDNEAKFAKFMIGWTYLVVMTFAPQLGIANLTIGILNNLTHNSGRRYLKNNFKRLFVGGIPYFSKQNKASALIRNYDIVNYHPDVPDGSMMGRFVKASTWFISAGEEMIQKTAFLANIDDATWDNFTVGPNGEVVWIDPNGPTLGAKEIAALKVKSSNVQGKYDPHDARNYKGIAMWQMVGQFKTWLPDMLRLLFGKPSVDVFGERHVGMVHGAMLWMKWIGDVPTKGFAAANANYQQFKTLAEYKKAEHAALKSIVMLTAMYIMWLSLHGDDEDKDLAEDLQNIMRQYLGLLDPREILTTASVPLLNTLDKAGQVFTAATERVMYTRDSKWGKKDEYTLPDKIVQASPWKNLIGWAGGFQNPDYGKKKSRGSSQSEFDNFGGSDSFGESFN